MAEENTVAPDTQEEDLLFDQYTFTCSGQGAESGESNLLKVIPPGVPIHFMRYGLAKEDLSDLFITVYPKEKKEPTWQTVDGAPDIAGYKYVRTSLRNGWIYIFDEEKNQIRKYGTDDMPVSPYLLQKDKTIWAAYSEVEWSKEYADSMCSNTENRSKRMQKISWDDWYNKQQLKDGIDVEQVDAIFYAEHENYNFGRGLASARANEEDPEKKENLFFCLHDPLAIADELTGSLKLLWYEMEALVISLQTGLEKDVIVKELHKGKVADGIASLQDSTKLAQVDALFKTAVLLKHGVIAYDKSEGPEKVMSGYSPYGGARYLEKKQLADYLDKERIRKLLAITEREELKKKIKVAKECLVNFLTSCYYQENLHDYLDNCDENSAFGKGRSCIHTGILRYWPNEKDNFIDTKEENKKWEDPNDPGREYVRQTNLYNNIAGRLLQKKTVVDLLDVENTAKVFGVFNSLLGNYVDYTDEQLAKTTDSYTILSSIELKLEDGRIIKLFDEDYLPSIFRNPPATEQGKKIVNLAIDAPQTNAYIFGVGVEIKQLRLTKEFELETSDKKSLLYRFAHNMQYSERWNLFTASVAYVNLGLATIGLGKEIKDSNGFTEISKNSLKVVGSISDVFSAHWQLKVVRATASGASKETLKLLTTTTAQFAAGAAFFGAAVDLVDAGINFSEKDYDAGMAYSASAICGTLLGYGLLFSWNPIGMGALLLAGFGFGVWAFFLNDSPLEQLIKNCPFTKMGATGAALKGNYLACINFHLDNSTLLAEESLKGEWADYTKFYEAITDIMFAGRVNLVPKTDPYIKTGLGYTINTNVTKYFKVEISLGEFTVDYSQLQTACYLFPYGLENKTGRKKLSLLPNLYGCEDWLLSYKDKLAQISGSFRIPKEYDLQQEKYQKATVIFLFRTIHGKTQGWPAQREGKARFMAYKLDIVSTTVSSYSSPGIDYTRLFDEHVQTGTLSELVSVKLWK